MKILMKVLVSIQTQFEKKSDLVNVHLLNMSQRCLI